MEKVRCGWSTQTEKMSRYHDEVWGRPVYDDQQLFQKLILDMMQAGLSWSTILNKWENFDEAFDGFAIDTVAKYDEAKVEELMNNAGIIRNRRKIEAAIHNAQVVQQLQKEFGSFSNYLWGFVDGQVQVGGYEHLEDVPATTELSDRMSKDMKKRGFKFAGSTTIYAFLQAVGIVNDHVTSCFRYQETIK